MKKLCLIFSLSILMAGCLGENRLVKIRRSNEDLASGVSIHSGTEPIWWRTPVYRDTPKDENPWEIFIPDAEPNRWMDPWGNDPATNYGADSFPKAKPVKLPDTSNLKFVEDPPLWVLPPYVDPDDYFMVQ